MCICADVTPVIQQYFPPHNVNYCSQSEALLGSRTIESIPATKPSSEGCRQCSLSPVTIASLLYAWKQYSCSYCFDFTCGCLQRSQYSLIKKESHPIPSLFLKTTVNQHLSSVSGQPHPQIFYPLIKSINVDFPPS